MKKLSNILLVVCLVAATLGFSDVGSNIFSGFFRAMGAVFFILTFITRIIEHAEAEQEQLTKSPVSAPKPADFPVHHGHLAV